MPPFLAIVLVGVFVIGGNALGYSMFRLAARSKVETWAKEKNYRLIELKPGSMLTYLLQYVTFRVTYEDSKGVRDEVVATYSQTFGGLVNSLKIAPKDAFDYNKY